MNVTTSYETWKISIKLNRNILFIAGIGFIARILYVIFFSDFVAQNYFGHPSYFANTSDFAAWTDCIKNLIHTGEYTVNPNNSYGYFGRMPGYAFLIAPFYILLGENYFTYAVSFTQVLLDTYAIYLVFRISQSLFPNTQRISYVAALLYALHPIQIIWSSALFSESLSVFLLILSLYVYTCKKSPYKYFIVGLLSGFNILVRPQLVLFAFLLSTFLAINYLSSKSKQNIIYLFYFVSGVVLTYAPWPARNYFLHDKVIFTQDIRGFAKWGIDVNSYLHYIVSIQGNWEPQFSQIIHNEPFLIDTKNAYVTPTDSADLARAIFFSQHYGSGFSNWSGYWKHPVERNSYDTIIAELFTKLQRNQMEHNAFHYWITLPINNLKKCFFKLQLTSPNPSVLFKMATLMFIFRTCLILLGIIGSILLFKKQNFIFKLILLFFALWYLMICWGPSDQMRNVEMRYLLQVDTLMIIPAAYLIGFWTKSNASITPLYKNENP